MIYILSGPMGCGKSTFVKENHLENNVISLDDYRKLIQTSSLIEKPLTQDFQNEVIVC